LASLFSRGFFVARPDLLLGSTGGARVSLADGWCALAGAQAGVPVPLVARIFVLVVLGVAEAGWGARDDYGDFSVRVFFARCLGVPRMRRSL
jgi:hypothetical protein